MISVIIPMYNAEIYIKRCLNSVINQTYTDLEIILVNDGSSDGTLLLAKEFIKKDKRVKLINKENEGLSSARNAGKKIAQGEYISFLDIDDVLYKNYFELLISQINDETEVLFYRYKTVKDTYKVGFYNQKIKKEYVQDKQLDKWIFLNNNLYSVCRILYKKELIKNIWFDEEACTAEDQQFNYKVFKSVKKVEVLNCQLYLYFQHANNISLSNQRNNKKFEKEMEIRYSFMKEETNVKFAWIHYCKGVVACGARGFEVKGRLKNKEKFSFLVSPYVSVKYKIGLIVLMLKGRI